MMFQGSNQVAAQLRHRRQEPGRPGLLPVPGDQPGVRPGLHGRADRRLHAAEEGQEPGRGQGRSWSTSAPAPPRPSFLQDRPLGRRPGQRPRRADLQRHPEEVGRRRSRSARTFAVHGPRHRPGHGDRHDQAIQSFIDSPTAPTSQPSRRARRARRRRSLPADGSDTSRDPRCGPPGPSRRRRSASPPGAVRAPLIPPGHARRRGDARHPAAARRRVHLVARRWPRSALSFTKWTGVGGLHCKSCCHRRAARHPAARLPLRRAELPRRRSPSTRTSGRRSQHNTHLAAASSCSSPRRSGMLFAVIIDRGIRGSRDLPERPVPAGHAVARADRHHLGAHLLAELRPDQHGDRAQHATTTSSTGSATRTSTCGRCWSRRAGGRPAT